MTRSPATSLNKVRAWFVYREVRELQAPVYTLRARSATFSFWIVSGMLGLAVASAIGGGQLSVILFSVTGAALLIWLMAVLLLIPAVYYNDQRVVVLNFARVHVLPWWTIDRVDQGIDMVFTLKTGQKIHAYGSPYPRRGSALMPTRKTASSRNFDGDSSILEGFRSNARDTGAVATHSWDATVLFIGAGLAVLFLLANLAGRLLT